GLVDILNKYKYEQGIASSIVNSIVTDLLHLSQANQPNPSSFNAYKKIVASNHLQEIYLEKTNANYIKPLSLTFTNLVEGQTLEAKYSVTPLLPILTRVLKNQSLVDHLWKESSQNWRNQNNLTISTSLDASFALRLKGKLKLEIYADDTQYSPSFMNKNQKFTCVYISIADIPFHLRTKKEEIDIYMLVNKKSFDKLKFDDNNFELFSPLRTEIETINHNGGIRLCSSTGSYFNVYVTISSILGDNLAIYPLLGFSGSFNPSSYRCRFCLEVGRSREGNDIQVSSVRRPLITSLEESNENFDRPLSAFVFDGFDQINKFNISPPDIMHDLSEGVIPATFELIFTNVATKYVLDSSSSRAWQAANKEIIIKSFENFHFFEGQPSLKWVTGSGKSGFKITGTALQKTEAFLKIEAIFVEILNHQWPEFALYKSLREFVLLAFAPTFTSTELTKFETLANKILEGCLAIQPEFSVYCKLHHLTHYGDLTKLFGPLYLYSTFRSTNTIPSSATPTFNNIEMEDASLFDFEDTNYGLVDILNKYKYEQGIASSIVNSIVTDLLHLSQANQPNPSSFNAYKKIVASNHLQEIYLEKTNANYIKPLSLTFTNLVEGQTLEAKYSVTPLLPILTRVLKNQSLVDHLWKESSQNWRNQNNLTISTSLDASFALRLKGKLKLEIYADDTQYSPSFMNKNQKFTCVYISIADIPFHLRTKKEEIDIYMLVNKKSFDKLKFDDNNFELFSPLRTEIETINHNGGIRLCSSTGSYFNVYVTISSILGDNLAIYPLLGFSGSFNPSSYRCRFCLEVGRSREGNDIQVSSVRRPLITSLEESNENFDRPLSAFVFDGFDQINKFNISPPDIMHDLSEGVIPATFELIFTNVATKYVLDSSSSRAWQAANKEIIIKSFENFHFFEGQPSLKWVTGSGKSGFKITGTALQKTEAFLKIEAIFVEILNHQWPEFALYKSLREFVLLAFAPTFTSTELTKFETLANKILEGCLAIQPEFSVYCKLHHLTHYGDLTKLFGPLYLYSTFRYERVHQFGKKVCRSSKNFRNLAVTINSKNQKHRAYFLEKTNFVDCDLFPIETRTISPLQSSINENCQILPSSFHPFPVNKCILRKLESRRDLYFLTTEFYKDTTTGEIYCYGKLMMKKTTTLNNRPSYVKLNESLFELEVHRENKYIKFSDLHYSNDFIFYYNSKMYLLDWIM
ncbi:hypothetical protein TYRP_005233, partial [Tyrophagus putrescentiae]